MKNVIVEFKSEEEYYIKEESGIKPSTTREVDFGEKKHRQLLVMHETGEFGKIKIREKRSLDSFERKITDITYWESVVIISWRHEK